MSLIDSFYPSGIILLETLLDLVDIIDCVLGSRLVTIVEHLILDSPAKSFETLLLLFILSLSEFPG